MCIRDSFGIILATRLSPTALADWGWRIPLGFGCLIVPLLLFLRRSLPETQAFKARTVHPGWGEILSTLASHWRRIVTGMMLTVLTTVTFYMITVYTPAFGTQTLHLASLPVFVVTLLIGASNFVWLPVMGAVSDRIGRKPVLIAISAAMLISAYPAMLWLCLLYTSRCV